MYGKVSTVCYIKRLLIPLKKKGERLNLVEVDFTVLKGCLKHLKIALPIFWEYSPENGDILIEFFQRFKGTFLVFFEGEMHLLVFGNYRYFVLVKDLYRLPRAVSVLELLMSNT